MSLLRRLLLLPLLAPLLAVLVIGAVNPRPAVRMRLLTWTSPPLPIGVWLLLASGGGAVLSAGATALALQGQRPPLQRQVVREVWPEAEDRRAPRNAAPPPPPAQAAASAAGPSRPPGEPAPTVAVTYRVIRRPAAAAAPAERQGGERHGAGGGATPASGTTQAGGDDGWEPLPGEDW
ncbi:hypothetical protein [Cyanobium sp. CH-040]|uniref:hypothetical protein n=1 Tax=Cyanobium sp. CH-040 TaxID=2823708 RepID=UPI0020CCE92B|nr:hypothetical protein [Cyanobium sp. CH-040]MCP9927579.1 hypothetical protein [Cyanobium sp. CH-040]